MELVYLWIERYNNIIDTGFNFSSEFEVNYKKEDNQLQIDRTEDSSPSLFNEQFLNINAVVGKNGSGKTSLFSFFQIVFASQEHEKSSYPFILVTKKNDGQIIIFDNSRKPDLNYISQLENIQIKDDCQDLIGNVQPIYFANGISSLNDNNRAFSSTFYDASINADLKRAVEKSNHYLIEDFERFIEGFPNPDKDAETKEKYEYEKKWIKNWRSPLPFLEREDIITKLDFISKYKKVDLGLIPDYLELSFNGSFFFNNKLKFGHILGEELAEKFSQLLGREINPYQGDFKLRLMEGIILSFYLYIINYQLYFEIKNSNIDEIVGIFKEKSKEEYPSAISTWISESEVIHDKGSFVKIQNLLHDLKTSIESILLAYTGISDRLFLVLDDNLKALLNGIFDCWYEQDFIFNLNWGKVSAGESAILTLFAHIHSLSKNEINKTIWLFLDEVELYLHPEWQRDFFNNLHTYLPEFFGEDKIQLIISSHSPFVISDIPKSNIIFLNKKADSSCEVINNKVMPETFGANIHELLATSFFMHEGVIGEFAKGKINSLITYLKSDVEANAEWNLSNSWQLINTIGDENVRSFLIEFYNKKVSKNPNIDFLEEQINKLQAIKAKIEGGQDD